MRKTTRSLLALMTAGALGACSLGRSPTAEQAAPSEKPAGAATTADPSPTTTTAMAAPSPDPAGTPLARGKAAAGEERGDDSAPPPAGPATPRVAAAMAAPPPADARSGARDHGSLGGDKGGGVGSAAALARRAPAAEPPAESEKSMKREASPARPVVVAPRGAHDEATAEEAPRQRSGLQGGTRDDVGQRQDYLRYTQSMAHLEAHRPDVSQRVMITVRDDLEAGLPNATITVKHQGRTVATLNSYANGKAQFFPRAAGLRGNETVELEVTSQGRTEKRTLDLLGRDQDTTLVVATLAQRKSPTVDVMFVLDTTGSMGDEIARIQLTLLDVAARVHALEPSATIRYGLTLYRDRGDDYVTRVTDFTTDTNTFLKELQAVEADGGGDTPEALNEGIHAALHGASWTPANVPNAVRVAILVADAPPHLDYPQDRDYAREMKDAAARGIKIFPVAASGLDDQGEFVFRQMAHHTMARFVFITYGGGTSHHVGQFANNNLDDLVVGLLADELADLTARPRAAVRALAMRR
jgi:hypothetical protein